MNKKLLSLVMLVALLCTAVPAGALAAPPAQGAGAVYTVQQGDTLAAIAQKEYGDVMAFQAIVYYNNEKAKTDTSLTEIKDPTAALQPGWKLYLPTAEEVKAYVAGQSSASATPAAPTSNLSGQLQLAGSTSVQPPAELLAAAFMQANPGVKVTVQGGGSGVGVTSAVQGTADIGNVSRDLSADEKAKYPELQAYVVAIDGIAIVVNPGVTLPGLTPDQVRAIFAGQVTNFKDVGGPDATIVVVTREEGSGTRDFFTSAIMGQTKIFDKALVQQSNGQVRTTIATTPNSIGYLSFGFMDNTTRQLPINGVAPTVENVLNNSYPLWRHFNMITKGTPSPLAKAFLDFIFTPAGKAIVTKEWISVDQMPAAATFTCPASAQGTLKMAGSTSVQPLAEVLAADFMKLCPNVKVEVSGGGSGVGVTSAFNQTADIGNVSRDLSKDEMQKMPELHATRIAVDGVAIVVNPGVTLPTLSLAQARDIFAGTITNFKDVGGPDAPIVVVTREEGSGTRDFFTSAVMGSAKITEKALIQQSNGQVRTTVASTPNSIGYISFGFLDATTKPVSVDNVQPTPANVLNKSYPLWRYFNMVTKGNPNYLAQLFLNYLFSPQGQAIIQTEGYMTHAPN
jgi:phosphate transport system substrate-binding protein